jgi:hypothetical protein
VSGSRLQQWVCNNRRANHDKHRFVIELTRTSGGRLFSFEDR